MSGVAPTASHGVTSMVWFWVGLGAIAILSVVAAAISMLGRGAGEGPLGDSDALVRAKLRIRAIATWIPSSIPAIRQLREETFTPEGATPPDWKADTCAALEVVVGRGIVTQYEQQLASDAPEENARVFLVELVEKLQPSDLR